MTNTQITHILEAASIFFRMSILDSLQNAITQDPQDQVKKRTIGGQLYWHHSLLSNWYKNEELRILKEKDWLRLLKSIKKNGIKQTFEIDERGTVYDGNHRLRAINELISEGVSLAENGKDLEWIPVHINTPKNEVEELALALKGNDQEFAVWNKDAVANNKELFEQVEGFEDYSFSYDDPITFGDVFETYDETFEEETEEPKQTPKACEACKQYHEAHHQPTQTS